MKIIDVAKALLKKGFSVIPVNSTKNPSINRWGVWQITPMSEQEADIHFKDAWGIALLTGGQSRVWLLDIDAKYDLTGRLWTELREAIPNSILQKAYVQETMNGGYHMAFIIPAEKVEPNTKYASRHTTEYEKDFTYRENFKNPETRSKALKIAMQDSSRVLLESRGGKNAEICGGYFLIPPSPGYKHIYGKLQEISAEEYDIVVEIARSFNEVVKEDTKSQVYDNGDWVTSPFDHYNLEGDVVQVLLDYGWSVISENGDVIRFKRPGLVHSASSALFDKSSRVFTCFSTSTAFDSKSYNCCGVLAVLKFDEDYNKTFNWLVKNNWGKK